MGGTRASELAALRPIGVIPKEVVHPGLLDLPLATISLSLKRLGLGKRSRLAPPNRYERRRPGELGHVEISGLRASPRAGPVTGCSAIVAASTRGACEDATDA